MPENYNPGQNVDTLMRVEMISWLAMFVQQNPVDPGLNPRKHYESSKLDTIPISLFANDQLSRLKKGISDICSQ